MKLWHWVALSTLALLHSASGLAQTVVNTYEPANFPAAQSSLTSQIDFPDYPGNIRVRVFCDARLSKSGKFQNGYCWSDHADGDSFIKAALQGSDRAAINPARVNGRDVPIWFQYTVQFEKRDENESIKLFPHQFIGIDGTGDGYIGPQRYDDPSILGGILYRCTGEFRIWYSMLIPAEGGKPTSVTPLTESDNVNCRHHYQAVVENGLYIPAFLDGVAAMAPYREVWALGWHLDI